MALQLTQKGDKLATASEKGTLIRIHNTEDGSLLQEVRRGKNYAVINSLAFDINGSKFFSCSSDSGTTHLF